MNINEATGEIELHKNQQEILRKAKNIVEVLMKVDPNVAGIDGAIAKYCDPIEEKKPEPAEAGRGK